MATSKASLNGRGLANAIYAALCQPAEPKELLRLLPRWRPGIGDSLTLLVVLFTATCAWRRRCPWAPLSLENKFVEPASGILSEREALLQVLRELCRRQFHQAREVANMARAERQRLENAKVPINTATFSQEFSKECGLAEKLIAVQKDVLAHFRRSENWVARVQARLLAEDDQEVRILVEGTCNVFQDALLGLPPVLPWMQKPPENLSKETVIKIYCHIQRLQLEAAPEWLSSLDSSEDSFEEDVVQVLQLVRDVAEGQVLEENRAVMGEVGELYHSAMALHRRDAAYAAQIQRLDEDHKRAVVAIFKEATSSSESG